MRLTLAVVSQFMHSRLQSKRLTIWLRHCLMGATVAIYGLPVQAATWDHVHGDATNSGFLDVPTLPALQPSATVPAIGTYAPGAGPVIAADGTVYLGSLEGELRALHADGSLAWKRTLAPQGQAILASPVIDTDGSIYVVGVKTFIDHRVTPAVKHSESRLYRFVPGGGLLWVRLFPSHYPGVPNSAGNGATTAPPNIWRRGDDTAIIVPAVYRGLASKDVRLLAFTTGGALIDDRLVGAIVPQTFGSSGLPDYWVIGCGLTLIGCLVPPFQFCPSSFMPPDPADRLPAGIVAPLPGVAIFTFAGGGTPWIIATDQASTIVGWTFSMAGGFTAIFHKSWDGILTLTPPMVLPDGHSVIGMSEQRFQSDCGGRFVSTGGRVTFNGPNSSVLNDVAIDPGTVAAAGRTSDGRIIVARDFAFDVLRESTNLKRIQYPGQSIAAPAVSHTRIFISTAGSLRSYDVNTLAKVGEVNWFGGGQSGPAIAPSGRVYALASNILFIWPAPCIGSGCFALPPGGGVMSLRP